MGSRLPSNKKVQRPTAPSRSLECNPTPAFHLTREVGRTSPMVLENGSWGAALDGRHSDVPSELRTPQTGNCRPNREAKQAADSIVS